jgi:hypothetical protein
VSQVVEIGPEKILEVTLSLLFAFKFKPLQAADVICLSVHIYE